MLEGSCRLTVDGHVPLTLEAGDFVLLPATPGFSMSGFEPVRLERFDPNVTSKVLGDVRHGTRGGRPDVRWLGGWFAFDSPDTALLVSLLPSLVHVRGVERLSTLVRLVGEEASERRSGRDLVLTRLVEVLLIEALRLTPGEDAPPGLLRGLADERLAPAIRQMHGQLAVRGPSPSSRRRLRCRARRSSNALLGCRHATDGIPARLADGDREGSVATRGPGSRRCRRTRRGRYGEHVQHGIQPTRWRASESLPCNGDNPTNLTSQCDLWLDVLWWAEFSMIISSCNGTRPCLRPSSMLWCSPTAAVGLRQGLVREVEPREQAGVEPCA